MILASSAAVADFPTPKVPFSQTITVREVTRRRAAAG
jgi:hypothetical protein